MGLMNKNEAFRIFSEWYESCIENGIEPEEIVWQMGGVALVTDQDLVDRLESNGDIRGY